MQEVTDVILDYTNKDIRRFYHLTMDEISDLGVVYVKENEQRIRVHKDNWREISGERK